MSFFLKAIAPFLLLFFFCPVAAQESGHTGSSMTEALRQTYLNNPSLRAARADLHAVAESLPQAVSAWLPDLEAQGAIQHTDIESKPSGEFFGAGDGSVSKNLGVSLNQSIYQGGSNFAQRRAALNVIRARIAALVSQEQSVLNEAVQAYMDVYRDIALLDLQVNNRTVLERQFEAARQGFEVGELTRTDVEQANARLADAKALIITAQGSLTSAQVRFYELTGLAAQELALPDTILPLPENLDDAILIGMESNPDIIAAVHTQRAAEDDVDSVFGELLPSLSLAANWDKTYDPSPGILDEQTSSAVGLFATIPLYKSGDVRSRVRQAKHTANRRQLEIIEARRAVRQQIVTRWEALKTAEAEIEARASQVEASEIAREGVAAEAQYGARTTLDKLNANQELLDAQVALITAQRNKVVAQYALLESLGHLTPETLGFAEQAFSYAHTLSYDKSRILNMHVDRVEE